MTYAERIEAIARAIYPEEWKNQDALRELEPSLWAGEAEPARRARLLEYAGRADLACLKAIEEPTQEMLADAETAIDDCKDSTQDSYGSYSWTDTRAAAIASWNAAHAAIPRGDK